MNRLEFEELELQMQQSGLPLKSYLQQIGISYSTYHYWRRKCSVDGNNASRPIKQTVQQIYKFHYPFSLKKYSLFLWE